MIFCAFASRLKRPVISLLVALVGVNLVAAQPSNYLVVDSATDLFVNENPDLEYHPTDFNNERMVCGYWVQTAPDSSTEVAHGLFIWRGGVMKHIAADGFTSPAYSFSNSPNRKAVSMTDVMSDGNVYLVADGYEAYDFPWPEEYPPVISRVLRFKIDPDLVESADPVLATEILKGFTVEYQGFGQVETFAFAEDVSDEGIALGSVYNYGYFNTSGLQYREATLWGLAASEFGSQEGSLVYLDGNGYALGDAWPTYFERPVAGGAVTNWRKPTGYNSVEQEAAHGPYRVQQIIGGPTAVWTTGFIGEAVLVPDFTVRLGISERLNRRTNLTFDGHMLGRSSSPFTFGAALALRGSDQTYTVMSVASMMALGHEERRPRSTVPFETWADELLAVNDNLDLLATLDELDCFYVLRDYANAGRVRLTYAPEDIIAFEYDGFFFPYFTRELGKSGVAKVRVSLVAGGTATPGEDFPVGATTVVEWADGEGGNKSAFLPLINDTDFEADETVKVVVSDVEGTTYEGETEFLVKIVSDDPFVESTPTPTPSPTPSPTPTPTPSPTPTPDPSGAPVITSAATAFATVGTAFSYQIVATNAPTSYLILDPDGNTELPNGFVGDAVTGQITGTPIATGYYFIWTEATNGAGSFGQYLRVSVYAAGEPTPTPTPVSTPTPGPTPTPVSTPTPGPTPTPVSTPTPVPTPTPQPPTKPEDPKLSVPTKVATTKSSYKVSGSAGKVPSGSVIEYKVGRGEKLEGKIKRSGKFVFSAKLEDGKNVVKMKTVTPDGEKSRTKKITIIKE